MSEVDSEPCKQPELEHPVFVEERESSGHVAQDGEPLPERPPATPLSHDVGEAAVDILAASADASSREPRDQVDNAEQIANDSGASGSVGILEQVSSGAAMRIRVGAIQMHMVQPSQAPAARQLAGHLPVP